MRYTVASIFLSVMAVCGAHYCDAQQSPKAPKAAGRKTAWKLVWADEFNYQGRPDASKWGYDLGANGWGNNEKQNYIQDSSTSGVRNGHLYITARQKVINGDTTYTAAKLTTRGKSDWKYGKIEIKAKVAHGRGLNSAIWMMPVNCEGTGGWPACGEIDIMEHIEITPYRDTIFQTVHTGAYNHVKKTQKGVRSYLPNSWQGFHVYAVEWTPEGVSYYIDGKFRYTFPNEHKTSAEWPFDKNFFLILNISVGGNWEGAQGIDPAIFPATMQIDYVRVYQ